MNKQVAALKRSANAAVQGMGVPVCKNCAHRSDINKCMVTGWHVAVSRKYQDECGHSARFWTPKPPTFWERLKDAIIDRVRGH